MKTKVNKSNLLKRAWSIYRGTSVYSFSFSDSLKRAWEVEKENIAYAERKEQEAAEKEAEAKRLAEHKAKNGEANWNEIMGSYIADQYANAPAGTYFGD